MEFLETLFGDGVTKVTLLVYLVLGLFGVVTSLIFDVYSSGIAGSEFKFKIFWSDNAFRIFLSVIVVILAMIFGEEIIGIKTSNWSVFLAGFTSDKAIENLLQRRRRRTKNK